MKSNLVLKWGVDLEEANLRKSRCVLCYNYATEAESFTGGKKSIVWIHCVPYMVKDSHPPYPRCLGWTKEKSEIDLLKLKKRKERE